MQHLVINEQSLFPCTRLAWLLRVSVTLPRLMHPAALKLPSALTSTMRTWTIFTCIQATRGLCAPISTTASLARLSA